jgi:hypothetical protein
MPDLGDGREYSATNWSMVDYAGNGKWSREEDIYNPAHFGTLLTDWQSARDAHPDSGASGSRPIRAS